MHIHSGRPRGTILLVVLICIIIIAGISGALMATVQGHSDSVNASWTELTAFQLAESAMSQATAALKAQSGANGDTVAATAAQSGNASTAVRWDTSSKSWVSVGSLPTFTTSGDVGITVGNTTWGAGDGFAAGPELVKNVAGETGWYAFRMGSQSAGNDEHFYNIQLKWWGSDGIDNNNDGATDTDAFELRTYTIRAAGIYGTKYVELESIVNRDPPVPAVDPNNPPAGFLAAISVQVSAGSGAPAGKVDFFNASSVNDINGIDTQTNISGASSASSTNNTTGLQLAASGAALSLDSKNPTNVTGTGGTPSYNNSGTFIGAIIDTIADGAKKVAVDSSGNKTSDASKQALGTTTSLKIVYHDVDANGPLTVGDGSADTGRVSVAGPGYGILVVDVDTVTSVPPLKFAGGGSTWEGIVIVRVRKNLAPSSPNGAVQSVGSGGGVGQMGSIVIYAKDQANFNGNYVFKNNGNRSTNFSMGAVQAALTAFNNAVPPTTQSTVSAPLLWRPIRAPGMTWAQD